MNAYTCSARGCLNATQGRYCKEHQEAIKIKTKRVGPGEYRITTQHVSEEWRVWQRANRWLAVSPYFVNKLVDVSTLADAKDAIKKRYFDVVVGAHNKFKGPAKYSREEFR